VQRGDEDLVTWHPGSDRVSVGVDRLDDHVIVGSAIARTSRGRIVRRFAAASARRRGSAEG
ncbi:MAG: hypothetical protein ACR2PK_10130, partial [Acidimicrobiales bacterium]